MPKNGKNTKRTSKTDWDRVRRMTDSEIDYSDNPSLPDDFFDTAIFWPGRKQQITLRLDPDVLAFFKKTGRGYQTTINGVLRRYMESRKRRAG
jgi:uncharacterized protein (DUF4415 family)